MPNPATFHDKGYVHYLDEGKEEITLMKILVYQLVFFIPLLCAIVISFFIAQQVHVYLETSVSAAAQIIMIPFIFLVFFLIIPYIRKRENIRGVRLSLFGYLIVAFFMSIPPMFAGMYDFLPKMFIFVATYILLVFIYCPEVLGVSGNIHDWFRQGKQLIIIAVYFFIVIFYILGFAWIYYEINLDPEHPGAFATQQNLEKITYVDFAYYSIISYATIGYGDITPVSIAAKLVAGIEALVGILMSVLFIAILLVYVSNFQIMSSRKEEAKLEAAEKRIENQEEKIEEEEKEEIQLLDKLKQRKMQ